MDFSSKKLGKMLQYANTLGAQYVVVIGDEEIQQGKIELKEMATGLKQQLPLDTFSLSNLLSKKCAKSSEQLLIENKELF